MSAVSPHASGQDTFKNRQVSHTGVNSGNDSGYNGRLPDFACADTFAHSRGNAQMES
jgi:hypothetical protein